MGNRIFSDKSTEGKENAEPWLITTAFQNNRSLPSNEIHTSKYRWWSFIPKNLWEQFSKLQNIYFLVREWLTCRSWECFRSFPTLR